MDGPTNRQCQINNECKAHFVQNLGEIFLPQHCVVALLSQPAIESNLFLSIFSPTLKIENPLVLFNCPRKENFLLVFFLFLTFRIIGAKSHVVIMSYHRTKLQTENFMHFFQMTSFKIYSNFRKIYIKKCAKSKKLRYYKSIII